MKNPLQDIFRKNLKKIKKRIIKWWNRNNILNIKIKKMEEINSILRANHFDSVSDLIKHEIRMGNTIKYDKELKKDFAIVGPEFIDVMLLIDRKKAGMLDESRT